MRVEEAASRWGWDTDVQITPVSTGLINQSWQVGPPDRPIAIVQRLNTAIFSGTVHHDIQAITAHLMTKGLLTPQLIAPQAGGLWLEEDGEVWRALSVVGTETIEQLSDTTRAFSAGQLVGRFHSALADLQWRFRSVRVGVHDTPAHMRGLEEALLAHPNHRLLADVQPLARRLLDEHQRLGAPHPLAHRIVHGDLKISNLRFDGERAVALIDLDTLALGPVDIELGDAMRSWCNPASEADPAPRFSLELFEQSMRGYAEGSRERPLSSEEWRSIPAAIERVCMELSARFARDALEERYFGWDRRFHTRGAHNLARARGQDALREVVKQARPAMETIIKKLL